MSQSQKGKKSSTASDGKTLPPTTDRRPLVTSRTSPLIRVRFRNPIRLSFSGSCSGSASSSSASTTGGESRATAAASGEAGQSGGGQGCDRRRRSADSASMTSETAASDRSTAPVTTDDLGLVPRIRQYQKHELLQDRSPESGLSEVEAFLLEKQRLMDLSSTGDNEEDNNHDEDQDKLVPRAPHYVPHPILQVKTETGLTELELYLKQKEAQLEATADQQPAPGDAPS